MQYFNLSAVLLNLFIWSLDFFTEHSENSGFVILFILFWGIAELRILLENV